MDFESHLESIAHRYHARHPFDQLMQAGLATKEMLRLWAANRYYYQATIPRKDAAIVSKCPDKQIRAEWTKHIVAHDSGGLEEWLCLTDALGLSRDEVETFSLVLPGVRFACDAYLNFCKDRPWEEGICASMTHVYAKDIHRKRTSGWPKLYPWLPPSAYAYFEKRQATLQGEIDFSIDFCKKHFDTPMKMKRAVEIVCFKQDVLWSILDALHAHFFAPRACRLPRLEEPPVIERASDFSIAFEVRVLGAAAGGGLPQWNRSDLGNRRARHGCIAQMTQSSIAITTDGVHWHLVNCSPDFCSQWNDFLRDRALEVDSSGQPLPEPRLASILLTDAQIDHVGGLLSLRESSETLEIHCTHDVAEVVDGKLGIFSALQAYNPKVHLSHFSPPSFCHQVEGSDGFDLDGVAGVLRVLPISLGRKTPRYARHEEGKVSVSVCAFLFESGNRSILCAPCIPTLTEEFKQAATRADLIFADGTFYSSTELRDLGLSDRSAEDMGHVPIEATLEFFESCRARVVYVHQNNSNPLALADASANARAISKTVGDALVTSARDGETHILKRSAD